VNTQDSRWRSCRHLLVYVYRLSYPQAGPKTGSLATVGQKGAMAPFLHVTHFWVTVSVCKTVRRILSHRCLVCLSICPGCNAGVL